MSVLFQAVAVALLHVRMATALTLILFAMGFVIVVLDVRMNKSVLTLAVVSTP